MATVVSVSPSAEILTGEEETITLQVIDATIETSRYDEAGTIELEALAENATREEIQQVRVDLSSVTVAVNDVTVASGMLTELSVDESGMVTVGAVDAVRALTTGGVGQEYVQTPASDVLDDVFTRAGMEAVSQGGGTVGRPGYALHDLSGVDDDDGDNQDFLTSHNFTDTTCLEAIEAVTRNQGWYWYVDEENVVHVVDNMDDPTTHELEYVTETTAGLQSEPYRRVIVTGGNGASMEEGEDTNQSHLLSKTKVQGIAGTEDPTYRFYDSSIHTARVAQNVAVDILLEFQRQRATGEITIVGDPTIRPHDVVQMPDELGGEQYIVSSMAHKLSNSDGFLTTIGVGGLVDPAEIDSASGVTGPDSGTAGEPGDGDGGEDDDDTPVPSNPDDGTGGEPPDDGDDEDDGDGDDGGDGGDDDDSDDDDGDGGLPDGPTVIAP